jgi:hypothetical protein
MGINTLERIKTNLPTQLSDSKHISRLFMLYSWSSRKPTAISHCHQITTDSTGNIILLTHTSVYIIALRFPSFTSISDMMAILESHRLRWP